MESVGEPIVVGRWRGECKRILDGSTTPFGHQDIIVRHDNATNQRDYGPVQPGNRVRVDEATFVET